MDTLSTLSAWDAALSASTTGYFARLAACFYLLSIAASCWVWAVARRLPPGPRRIAACAPVVALQMAATPWLVDRARSAVLIVPVCGTLSLAAFKVAAYAMGRGPLALRRPWTTNLLQFGVVLSLPIIPKDAFKLGRGASVDNLGSAPPATWPAFARMYATKAGGAALAGSLAVWPLLPQLLRHWFYALCLSLTLGALWDFWCCVAVAFAGIPVAPSFDKPWLSTSFADYWSRRWNLTTTYLLRVLIYEPIRDGRLVPAAAASQHASAAVPHVEQVQPAAVKRATSAAAQWPAGPEEERRHGASLPHSSSTHSIAGREGAPLAASAGKLTGGLLAHRKTGSAGSSSSSSCSQDSQAAAFGAAAAGGGAAGAATDATSKQQHANTNSRPRSTGVAALLRRVVGLHATFVFSGLWHALIFFYATGRVTPHWFAFFSLQGPIMAAEAALKHVAARRGWALPQLASVLLTNVLLIVVARPLFFGPCDASGLCSAMMDNVRGGLRVH